MKRRAGIAAVIVLLVASLTDVASVSAGGHGHERQGILLGFNLGLGGANVEWDQANNHYESETEVGGAGSFRIGYAFGSQFALTFEGNGWTRSYDAGEITLTSALLKFTWYPGGGGFFLRAGAGGGRAKVKLEIPGPELVWEEGGTAANLGLGYEWRLARRFALGAAVDYTGLSIDNFATVENVKAGHTGFTVQFNWYL